MTLRNGILGTAHTSSHSLPSDHQQTPSDSFGLGPGGFGAQKLKLHLEALPPKPQGKLLPKTRNPNAACLWAGTKRCEWRNIPENLQGSQQDRWKGRVRRLPAPYKPETSR